MAAERTCRRTTPPRIGGDEFAAIFADRRSREEIERDALALYQSHCGPLALRHPRLQARASFGVATFPRDAADFQGLIRNADLALYEAKARGRNRVYFYKDEVPRIALLGEAAAAERGGPFPAQPDRRLFSDDAPRLGTEKGNPVHG